MAFLSAIVAWSLRNRLIVLVATLLFTIFGIRSALQLPIDAVPDVTNIQVQVITSAPALSPVEVEQYVSVPVERAMAGIPNTTEIRSISKYGLPVSSSTSACARPKMPYPSNTAVPKWVPSARDSAKSFSSSCKTTSSP
jgi:hypothetical protein